MIKSFNMATMPQRINTAIKTIDSVYDQADVIRLYLNNFDSVPEQFKRDKIEILQGEDLRSTGKVYSALNKDEYYFCIDDDLEYPHNYAKLLINKLNFYDDKIVVTLHGKILPATSQRNFFRRPIRHYACTRTVARDVWVNLIGNGVSLWNTNNFRVDYNTWKYSYMDDLNVSIDMQRQKIPGLVMAHKSTYLKYNHPAGTTLHEQYSKSDKTQTEIVNTVNPWKLWNGVHQEMPLRPDHRDNRGHPNVSRLRRRNKQTRGTRS